MFLYPLVKDLLYPSGSIATEVAENAPGCKNQENEGNCGPSPCHIACEHENEESGCKAKHHAGANLMLYAHIHDDADGSRDEYKSQELCAQCRAVCQNLYATGTEKAQRIDRSEHKEHPENECTRYVHNKSHERTHAREETFNLTHNN